MQDVEQVSKYVYLGELIMKNDNRGNSQKYRNRKVILQENGERFWKKPKLSITAGLGFTKCYVWSTLLYGFALRHGPTAKYHISTWKRLKCGHWGGWWTRRDTNEEVLRIAWTNMPLFDIVRIRKLSFFGDFMMYDSLQRDLIEDMFGWGGGQTSSRDTKNAVERQHHPMNRPHHEGQASRLRQERIKIHIISRQSTRFWVK